MLNISKESKHKPQDIIKRAITFFGSKGYGMLLKEEDRCNAYLEGNGGSVRIKAAPSQKGSSVEIISVEWDFQAKQFLEKI